MQSHLERLSFESIAKSNDKYHENHSMVEALADYMKRSNTPKETSEASGGDEEFTHIIIGSGMGGGVLARQLIGNNHRVMLLEKGSAKLLTHCLNTSRPHFDHTSQKPPGRDNELFFDMPGIKTPYETKTHVSEKDASYCGGGSYFGLGGRSLFWSLEAPEITEEAAKDNFPPQVTESLLDTVTEVKGSSVIGDSGDTYTQTREGWYTKALRILANSPPGDNEYPMGEASTQTKTYIQTAEEKLRVAVKDFKIDDKTDDLTVVPNGAEFSNEANLYYFPQSAYSTADWLIDQFYIKSRTSKILLDVEVTRFTLDEDGEKVVELDVIDSTGSHATINVEKSQVILCAGTVNTAAIALRSGKKNARDFKDHHPLVAQGLTDHEIWMAKYVKKNSQDEAKEQPLELSCHVKVHDKPALLTICTHAGKFYGHGFATGEPEMPKEIWNVLNIMLEFEAPLNEKGKVTLKHNSPVDSPVLEINRNRLDETKHFKKNLKELVKAVRTAFGFEGKDKPRLSPWGSVAHEVGTMRMDCPDGKGGLIKGVVDSDLKVHGVDNLYVCDLSVFPFSPQANPSRTLTALALRLADHFGKPKHVKSVNSRYGLGNLTECECRNRIGPPPFVCSKQCWKFDSSQDW